MDYSRVLLGTRDAMKYRNIIINGIYPAPFEYIPKRCRFVYRTIGS